MSQKPGFFETLVEFMFSPIAWIIVGILILCGAAKLFGSFTPIAIIIGIIVVAIVIVSIFNSGGKVTEQDHYQAERLEQIRQTKQMKIDEGVAKAVAEYQKMRHEWAMDKPDPEDIPDNVDEDGYFYMTDEEAKQIGQPPKRRKW